MSLKFKDVVYEGYGIGYAKEYDNNEILEDEVTIIDSDWVRNRFMVPDNELEDIDKFNRYFTSSRWKFVNSSLGGHIAINPRPQFTRYADIRHGSRLGSEEDKGITINKSKNIIGMGRYYSSAIDDNATMIYMSFGIPRFNSLLTYFTRAIDPVDSFVAKTGRLPTAYNAGNFIGRVVGFIMMPLLSTLIYATKFAVNIFSSQNSFNYYYMEPAPHLYWGTVNLLVNQMANEIGFLVPGITEPDNTEAPKMGYTATYDKEDITFLNQVIPGLISETTNYIDVYRLTTRAQAVYNRMMIYESNLPDKEQYTEQDFIGFVKKHDSEKPFIKNSIMNDLNKWTSLSHLSGTIHESFQSFIDFLRGTTFKPVEDEKELLFEAENGEQIDSLVNGNSVNYDIARNPDGSVNYNVLKKERDYQTDWKDTLDAAVRDGAEYIAFMVDYQGSTSESFSNSIGEIELASGVKSTAQAVRNVNFNIAGGNTGIDPLDEFIKGAIDTAKGALDGITAGFSTVVQNILGGGYVDFPKKWEDSDVSFPTITYKTRLVAPYGDIISQLQNIYIPLACLLAGALPLSVGRTSYTSPYLCSVFNRGVQKIDLGMITSLNIERGVSNLPFTKNKRALAIDVSWTVTDFSSLATAPINSSILSGIFKVTLDDDLPINKYLATIAGSSLYRNKYALPKLKLALSRYAMRSQTFFNGDMWAMRAGELLVKPLSPFTNTLGFNWQDNKY